MASHASHWRTRPYLFSTRTPSLAIVAPSTRRWSSRVMRAVACIVFASFHGRRYRGIAGSSERTSEASAVGALPADNASSKGAPLRSTSHGASAGPTACTIASTVRASQQALLAHAKGVSMPKRAQHWPFSGSGAGESVNPAWCCSQWRMDTDMPASCARCTLQSVAHEVENFSPQTRFGISRRDDKRRSRMDLVECVEKVSPGSVLEPILADDH